MSGQLEDAKVILEKAQPKLDIDHSTDKKGTTYLYLACENQNLPLVRLLLDSNASIQGLRPHGSDYSAYLSPGTLDSVRVRVSKHLFSGFRCSP
eukprot:1333977-Amorphochlora_amoeboformis.AAC.1